MHNRVLTEALGAVLAGGQLLDVVCGLALVHGSEGDVAEEEQASVVGPVK